MVDPSSIGADFASVLSEAGLPLRFRYFTKAYPGGGSYYDDDVTLTQSGSDLWISGVVQPIQEPKGNVEAGLFQQGLLTTNDVRLYVAGSIGTSGTWKVGLGSPARAEYGLINDGATAWEVGGTTIYKKLYCRVLQTGSLPEE